MLRCDCGFTLARPIYPVYCRCGAVHHDEASLRVAYEIANPTWVLALKAKRAPEDKGVGDTFARLLGTFGEAFKATSKALGIPCNCTRRQAEWNERWPY